MVVRGWKPFLRSSSLVRFLVALLIGTTGILAPEWSRAAEVTGSVVAGPSVVNLTTEGLADWMHWGLVDATSVNRKAGVTAQIKGFKALVTIKGRFTGGSPWSTLSWTGGTPTATQAGFAGGIYFRDLNNGYTFTVPADTTPRTLKVYLGGYITTSKVVATLSDGSAAPYVATFGDLSTGYARIVTIKYRAAASGQTLTFKHTLAGGTNNINVQAVTLQADVPPPALTKRIGGAWLSPESDNWPLIPIHAALLPDGRVLTYGTDDAGTQTGYFIYDVWDPAAGLAGGHVTLQNMTLTDIFCSAQVVLPQSGSVLIAGGDNWTGTSTTNAGNSNSLVYSNEGLTRANDMNRARWYASATVLTNGEIYIQGGSGGADRPEVRQLDGTFRLLSAADTSSLRSFYPRNFVAADGRIFGIDNFGRMYYVTPGGTGAIAMTGQLASANAGYTSSAAMFRAGRILQIGGNSNGAIVIDITGGSPVVTPTQSMSSQRQWVTATLLPDGRVLATGGSAVENELVDVNNTAEIWDPATGQWIVGASGARARLYHSEALLLPDATVLVGGGGAPGPLNNRHVEIYFPPYLYDAADNPKPRPSIASAPSSLRIGQQFSIDVGAANIARVTLLKTGSVTHSFNMDQRFLELPFTNANGSLEVQAPSNPSRRAARLLPALRDRQQRCSVRWQNRAGEHRRDR